MKYMSKVVLFLFVLVYLSSCGGSNGKSQNEAQGEVMVFAAASLTDVLSEIVTLYQKENAVKIKLNLASSGTLARQIEQGGEADIFLSASKSWADYVDSLGFIKQKLRTDIAANELVLIVPLNSQLDSLNINNETDFVSLLGQSRLSIGDPSHVPAGRYAKQSLDYLNVYNGLKDKLLPSKDVRSALMMVELGEAPLGIVYRTDAMKSKKVKIAGTFPEETHKPIVYVAGVCNAKLAAIDFYEFLNSDETLMIWQKFGFKK